MHQYGTTMEQARGHFRIDPETCDAQSRCGQSYDRLGACRYQNEITVEDVDLCVIADPLHLLECCMISDGGGAVVIAAADVARNTAKTPVWIIGTGEATSYVENNSDITVSAAAQSGPPACPSRRVSCRHRYRHDLRLVHNYRCGLS